MAKLKLNVEGMHCGSCEMLIQDSLDETDGIEKAEVSHKSGEVNVDFDDSKVSANKIKDIIKDEGYSVE